MMRLKLACLALLVPVFAPSPVSEAIPPRVASAAAPVITPSLARFHEVLASEGRRLSEHGIYIEPLNESGAIAASYEDSPMNPASVIKLATSLAALDALGPSHRFTTEFFYDGEIDSRQGVLRGDLILRSGSDPSFSIPDARAVGDTLRQLGIRRVLGSLVVVGAFNCNYNSQTDVSAGVFRRQSRIVIGGATRFEPAAADERRGSLLLTVESEPLLNLIYYQNAHSVNAMAEMLAIHVGGPEGVRRFVTERLGLSAEDTVISRASGLDLNRMTARGTVEVLRALLGWLAQHDINPEAVLPLAGVDGSTLADRFREDRFAGCILAKTGTLHESDGGVAALAGIAYTRNRGPILFSVCDMAEGRRVEHLRHLQDTFLKAAIDELGGPENRIRRNDSDEIRPPAGRIIIAQSSSNKRG